MKIFMLIKSQSGASVVFIMTMFGVTATLVLSLYSLILSNVINDISAINSEQTETVAENSVMLMTTLAQNRLNMIGDLETKDLQDYMDKELPKYIDVSYNLVNAKTTVDDKKFLGPIPNGPFSGMQATNRRVRFELVLKKTDTNSVTSSSCDALLSDIYPTQFSLFSFGKVWFGDPTPGGVTNTGAFYSADDFMMAGKPMRLTRVTAGGKFRGIPDSWKASKYQIFIATDDNPKEVKDYIEFPWEVVSGCSNCDGKGASWVNYADDRWNGQVADVYNGTKPLKYINKSYEFQIADWFDPIFAGEDSKKSEMKFAYKADIRIINGVWYLKNPANSLDWPGIPVWSDHPGSFVTWNEAQMESMKNVGQADISAGLPALNQWPAGTTPGHYSFYEYNESSHSLNSSDVAGIVSYGNIYRTTAARPGNWIPGQLTGNFLCGGAATCTNCTSQVESWNHAVTCSSGKSISTSTNLLNATRGGFKMAAWEKWGLGATASSKIWPMNFDVKEFVKNMKCPAGSHPGEIGCFFGSGKYMNRPFNGVVFISNSWNKRAERIRSPYLQNDIEDGVRGASSTDYAGTNLDSDQIASGTSQQQILPFQLCSSSLKGSPFDNISGKNSFKIPDCAKYKDHMVFKSRINAVRLINADVTPADLPTGLTIVTDGHMVVTGDVNSQSNVKDIDPLKPWTPIFFGGNSVSVLSNSWDDHNAKWDALMSATVRTASETILNMSISTSPWSQLIHLNENWGAGDKWKRTGPMIGNTETTAYKALNYEMDPKAVYSFTSATFMPPLPFPFIEDPHYRLQQYQPPGIDALKVLTPVRFNLLFNQSSVAKGGP